MGTAKCVKKYSIPTMTSKGQRKIYDPFPLRPADLKRDFGELAVLFTLEQDEPTTEPGLEADYEEHKERIFCLTVAENEQGELMGTFLMEKDL
jgi:hypothetical protein